MAYKFTLIFDNNEKSLTPEHGLPIKELGEYILSLATAVELDDVKCTLSQIKEGSYALLFKSDDKRAHDNFVSLMENLSSKDVYELPKSQREFGQKIKDVINSGKFFLRGKDNDDREFARVSKVLMDLLPKYYYETTDLTGRIIQVGSRSVDSSHIVVASKNDSLLTIYVDSKQDLQLAKFYKSFDNINFVIRIKRNFETSEIEQAKLVSFTIPSELKLHDAVVKISDEFGDLFPNVVDSIKTLTELRNQNS